MSSNRAMVALCSVVLSLVLSACGGGGGADSVDDAATSASTTSSTASDTASAQSLQGKDTTKPVIALSTHAGDGTTSAVLTGTATDNWRVAQVNWSSDQGVSGTAALTFSAINKTTWTATVGLVAGTNNITLTAVDGQGNTSSIAVAVAGPSSGTTPPPTSGAPIVSYTDTITGPITGGENNAGGYLSIFGSNFGAASGLGSATRVYIGATEVANYRYLGLSKVGAKLGLQQLTVQVGNLGGAALGVALPIKVVVNGVASNVTNTFMPSPGRVLFVSLSGNDTTAVPNDITHPWRSMQNMTTLQGVYWTMGAGDQVVIRGGNWSDISGVDTTWMKFGSGSGSPTRNGTANAWIHITAYPGPIKGNAIEDVHYTCPALASGGIQGPWSAIAGTSGEYISVSNLRMEVAGGANRDAAPINFQYTAGAWRVVNNELGPWVAGNSTVLNAAGISGHGNGMKIFGNLIHDIAGLSDLQNHGIYADTTAEYWEVGYNWIHDITGGSLVQFNDNEGGAGTYVLPHGGIWPGFVGIQIHHNWLENAAKYGVNFNDEGSVKMGAYQGNIWDNVIIGTQLPPLRINSTQPSQNLYFAFNTLYNDMTTNSGTGNGMVRSEGWAAEAGVANKFFDNIFMFGPNTVVGTGWFANVGGTLATTTTYNFKRNLYFANGQTPSAPSLIGDNTAIVANPGFTNVATEDFSTQSTSPARKAATQALPSGFVVVDDLTTRDPRPSNVAPDIGAYQAP